MRELIFTPPKNMIFEKRKVCTYLLNIFFAGIDKINSWIDIAIKYL